MPYKSKAKRLAYARKYRKTHPHNASRRRMYYQEAKARKMINA